jgi:hypothetical protein
MVNNTSHYHNVAIVDQQKGNLGDFSTVKKFQILNGRAYRAKMGTKMLRDPSLKSLSLPTTFQTLWFRIWHYLWPKLVNEGTISSECGVGRG